MKILILLLIAFNIHSITSNVVCGSSRHSNVLNVNRADDVIDIQFSPFSPVDGIRFTAILQINVNDSYLQENVKSELSTAQRSQTTGKLLIKMPKVFYFLHF